MGRRQRSLQTGTVVRTGLEVVTIQLHPLQLRTEVLRRAKVSSKQALQSAPCTEFHSQLGVDGIVSPHLLCRSPIRH